MFSINYFFCSGFLENSVEIYRTTILKSDVKAIALLSMSILRIVILHLDTASQKTTVYLS